jgi:ribosomal protein S18 acetylase RimI-like enzyme
VTTIHEISGLEEGMESMLFRVATDKDLEFISQLSGELFSRYGNYDEIVAAWFLEPGVITVVALERESRCGFAMLAMERQRMFEPRRGHLLAIGIFPQHQRKGIGRTLLEHMEEVARQYGSNEMRLWTAVDNEQALSFFEKTGFQIIGSEDFYYPKGQAALALSKELFP